MSDKNQYSIGEAIEAFLKKRGLKDDADIQSVIHEWPQLMGRSIANHTEKMWFREGIFYIRMTNPTWRTELAMARSKIADLLNRQIGRNLVQEVRIV